MHSISDIIKLIGKYHFLYVYKVKNTNKKKVKLFDSNNKLSLAKKITKETIKSNLSRYENKSIIKFTIRKISKKLLKKNKESKIKVIGGPIQVEIRVFDVSSKGKLIINQQETRNNTIYFTEKFLEKNKKIKPIHLKKIALKVFNRKLDNRVFSVNTVDKLKI